MTTDQKVFTQQQDAGTNQTDQTNGTQQTASGVFDSLVGPDKKFKTAEDLASGKQESDLFINKLQDELKELREELGKRVSVEDAIKQLQQERRASQDTTSDQTTAAPSQEELAKLVEGMLTKREVQSRTQANLEQAEQAVVRKFGDTQKAIEAITKKAGELGVTADYIQDLAANSPKAFYTLMGIEAQATPKGTAPSVTENNINTLVKPSTNDIQQQRAYYNQLRKENPTKYYSAQVQKELFELTKQEMMSSQSA